MPKRRKGETVQEFVSRAVPIIKKEHPEKSMKQVLGQAYGMARQGKKTTRKSTRRTSRKK